MKRLLSLEPLKSCTTCNSLLVTCVHNKAERIRAGTGRYYTCDIIDKEEGTEKQREHSSLLKFSLILEAGEMAQLPRAVPTLAGDPSSVPITT